MTFTSTLITSYPAQIRDKTTGSPISSPATPIRPICSGLICLNAPFLHHSKIILQIPMKRFCLTKSFMIALYPWPYRDLFKMLSVPPYSRHCRRFRRIIWVVHNSCNLFSTKTGGMGCRVGEKTQGMGYRAGEKAGGMGCWRGLTSPEWNR